MAPNKLPTKSRIQEQIRAAQESIRTNAEDSNLNNDKMDITSSSPEKSNDHSWHDVDYEKPWVDEEEQQSNQPQQQLGFAPAFPPPEMEKTYPNVRENHTSEHGPKTPRKHHPSKKKKHKDGHKDFQKAAKRKRKEQINDLRAHARKRRKHSRGWRLSPLDFVPGPKNDKRWEILDRIGRGRFSDVFSALDAHTHNLVAIKVDKEEVSRSREKDLLKKEVEIMKSLGDSPYSCNYIHFDFLSPEVLPGGGYFLVMELCKDTNISDWRKKQPGQCFGPKNGAALGKEMLKALKHFHNKGWLHRDIKPSNFIQPLNPMWDYHCYIVDFGLAKRWRDANGKIVPEGKTEEFVGTSLYASLAAHEKRFQSRADDLWSLMFMIIDCATNRLPWKEVYLHMEGRPTHERRNKMYKLKKEFTANPAKFLEYEELIAFMSHLNTLRFEDAPDYTLLLELLQSMVDNPDYSREQAEIDNSTVMVVIPRYAGLSKDRKPLCPYFLQCGECPDEGCDLEHPEAKSIQQGMPLQLCYKACVNSCNSAEPGSKCALGYHWTEQEEAHYRSTGMVPAQSLNPLGMEKGKRKPLCQIIINSRIDCKCNSFHPRQLLDPNCPYTDTRPTKTWTNDEEDFYRWYGVIPETDDGDPGPSASARCEALHPILRKRWKTLTVANENSVKLEDLARLQIEDSTITAIEKSFEEFQQISEVNDDARFERMRLIIKKHTDHWNRMFDAFEAQYMKRLDDEKHMNPLKDTNQTGKPAEFPALRKQSIKYDSLDHSVAVALEEFVRHCKGKLRDPQTSLCRLKPADAVKILANLQQDKDLAKYANLSKKLEQRVEKRLEDIRAERVRAEEEQKKRKKRQEEQLERKKRQEKQRRELLVKARSVKGEDFLRDIEKQVIKSKPKTSAEIVAENQKRLEKSEGSHTNKKAGRPIIVNIESEVPKKSPRVLPKRPKTPKVSGAIPRKGRNQPGVSSPKVMKAIEILQKKQKINSDQKKKRRIVRRVSDDSDSEDLDVAVVKKNVQERKKSQPKQVPTPKVSVKKKKPTPPKKKKPSLPPNSPKQTMLSPSGRPQNRKMIHFSESDDSSSDEDSSGPIRVNKKLPKKSQIRLKKKAKNSPKKQKKKKKKASPPSKKKKKESSASDKKKKKGVPEVPAIGEAVENSEEEALELKNLALNERDLEKMLDEQSDDDESSIGEDSEFIKKYGLEKEKPKPNVFSSNLNYNKPNHQEKSLKKELAQEELLAEIQRQVKDAKMEESIFQWIDKQKRELTADDILANFEIERGLAEKIYNRYIGIEKPNVNLREKKRKLEEMESKSLSPRKKRKMENEKGSSKRKLKVKSPKRKRVKVVPDAPGDCSSLALPDLDDSKFDSGPTWDILYARSLDRIKTVSDLEINELQHMCKKYYKNKPKLTDEEYDCHPLADYCAHCKLAGSLVFCEACPLGYHYGCTFLLEAPADDEAWYCHKCLTNAQEFKKRGLSSWDKLSDDQKETYKRMGDK